MSVGIDTTSASCLMLSWRSFIDYFSLGTSFYVESRANSGDLWTQRQPWTNPVSENIGPSLYTVDITDDIGTATQVQFRFQGTPLKFDSWYVDDVQFYIPGASAYYVDEYYQSLTVDIPTGESDLTFPTWTPYGYHSTENVDLQFRAIATTHMTGDEIPSDDSVNATFVIHYPYLHDVGVDSILSPITGPGTSYPVEIVIKNYGQFPEHLFNTTIQIGAEIQTDRYATDFETDDGGFTQTGSHNLWAWGVPTSGPGAAHSGTKLWGTVLGDDYVDYANERLDSPWITVPSTSGAKLSFWHWFSTESYYDGGNIKWSVDGSNWYVLGSYQDPYNYYALSTENYGCPGQPGFSGSSGGWNHVIMDLSVIPSPTFKIRFHFGSDSSFSSYPGWYVDDIRIYTLSVDPEYDDESWQGEIYLNPGETREITYDTFTPHALAEGNSGTIGYLVRACTLLTGDTHVANDCTFEEFVLTYTHDVTVKRFNEPSGAKETFDDIIFSQRVYTPDEDWYFYTSDAGAGYLCQDDFWNLTDPIWRMRWVGLPLIYADGSWVQGDPSGMRFDIVFYEDSGGSPGSIVADFTDLEPEFEIGEMYGMAYQAYNWFIDLPGPVYLEKGWVSIQSTNAPDNSWLLWGGSPEGNANALQNGGGLGDSLAFTLLTIHWHEPRFVYVKKGSIEPIQVLVNNVGTFNETCLLNINFKEYITDPYNGTTLYDDNVTDIQLDPLGDEQAVDFQSQLYALEGIYALTARVVPVSTDDVPRNNVKILAVGSDGTPPVSAYMVYPSSPDGNDGWYKKNVTIKLTTRDPWVEGVGSGVEKIEYQIDGGAWQIYPLGYGGFKLTTDGQHTVKFKATDMVGNVEQEQTIPEIKIDRTKPSIFLSYNVTSSNPLLNRYELTFFAAASDAASGLDRCEFYFNELLQVTLEGSSPQYQWSYNFSTLPHVIIKAVVYDVAGNNNSAQIENPTDLEIIAQPTPQEMMFNDPLYTHEHLVQEVGFPFR